MQRRELLKLMTGLPVGAALAGDDADSLAFPPAADKPASPHQLMYLHPGEISFLLGRPKNGKTTLAMSLALDYALAGKEVWYFSMAGRSREIAKQFDLTLEPIEKNVTANAQPFIERSFYTHFWPKGWQIPLNFFDNHFATHASLPMMQHITANSSVRRPELVIYDADSIDTTALSGVEEHSLAVDLRQRRAECTHLYKAAILITLALPGGTNVSRPDKRPLMEELKPRRDPRPGKSLADELYFVHRPLLYDEDFASNKIDAIELTRCNRLRPENHRRLLVRDDATNRLRLPNHSEVERAMAWSS